MTFVYLSGRRCLNFVGTMKHRNSAREELLTEPKLLSDWAVQGGLVDAAIDVTDDDLVAAIELREAIYRTVTARLDGRRLQPADVDLLNERASGAQLTPRLLRTGATRRDGTPSQLLAGCLLAGHGDASRRAPGSAITARLARRSAGAFYRPNGAYCPRASLSGVPCAHSSRS